MVPLLALAAQLLPLATMIPEVLRAFGSDKEAVVADKIIGTARIVTGLAEPGEAVTRILADPNKQLEFQQALIAERQEYARIAAQAEMHAGTQVTDRWRFDMASDSWLSKNIRPYTLIIILSMLAYALGQKPGIIDPAVLEILKIWGGLVFSAYFLGRGAEKIASTITKRRGD